MVMDKGLLSAETNWTTDTKCLCSYTKTTSWKRKRKVDIVSISGCDLISNVVDWQTSFDLPLSVFLFFRFCVLPFLSFIWRAAPIATLTFFRSMMGTAPLLTWSENTVVKITHRSSTAPTIPCISGFALITLSVVVASQLRGSLRTQVGVCHLFWFSWYLILKKY